MNQISWFFQNLAARIKHDVHFARRFFLGCIAVIGVVVLIIVLASCGKDEDSGTKAPDTEAALTDPNTPFPVPTKEEAPLEEDAHADVNALISQYFTALAAGDSTTIATLKQPIEQEELIKIEKESAYIEEFDNIKVYTKPGPMENTYVAIAYYEIKFRDVERLAPGLTTFYVLPGSTGSLYISGGDMDSRIEDYVKSIVAHDDVVELFATVNTRYNTAISEDNSLKAFMEGFSSRVEQEVSETMAAMQSGEGTGEDAAAAAGPVEEICTATDTVNVRSSDSENGEKIGKLQKGEKVTRLEAQENGWSRVSYNGSEAFVKSDYLEVDQPAAAEGESTEGQEGGTESAAADTDAAATTDTSSLVGKDKVTAKESVNVRKSASQDSEKLGVAYQGEHFKLLQAQSDGWCKIEFNGQTGYVKSEFVE